MNRDIYLIRRFSKIRLPVWVTCFPILGNFVFYTIYKSWMIAYSDPDFFWKQYRKVQFRTGGVIVCMILGSFLFCSIYLIFSLSSDVDPPFPISSLLWLLLFVVLFNIVYQPINLHFEPKRVLKDYKITNSLSNQDILKEELCPYNFEDFLNNWTKNFDKLSCFTLFSSDLTLRELWITNSAKTIGNGAKPTSWTKRNRFMIGLKEMKNVAGTTVSMPATMDELNKAYEKDQLNNIDPYAANIITQAAIRGFASGSCGHFSYLSAAGIWYIGALSTIFGIFNVKNNFTKKINCLGWCWTVFTFAISIAFFTFIIVSHQTGLIEVFYSGAPAFVFVPILIPPYLIIMTLITHLIGVLVWSLVNKKLSKVSFAQQVTKIQIPQADKLLMEKAKT